MLITRMCGDGTLSTPGGSVAYHNCCGEDKFLTQRSSACA